MNPEIPHEPTVISQIIPAPTEGRFAEVEPMREDEEIGRRTRFFTGNGTAYLAVPGLKNLEAVRLGLQSAPLYEDRQYPISAHGHYEVMREPLFMLRQGPDGGAVLMRSRISNHGLWQRGIKVYVTGDWEEPVLPNPESHPKPRGRGKRK